MNSEPDDERPSSIELDRKSHLKLGWTDGLTATFDITELRLSCQCAGCRARRDRGEWPLPGARRDDDFEAVDAKLVGSYALGIEWVDGACNSIYSFTNLRKWAEDANSNTES